MTSMRCPIGFPFFRISYRIFLKVPATTSFNTKWTNEGIEGTRYRSTTVITIVTQRPFCSYYCQGCLWAIFFFYDSQLSLHMDESYHLLCSNMDVNPEIKSTPDFYKSLFSQKKKTGHSLNSFLIGFFSPTFNPY